MPWMNNNVYQIPGGRYVDFNAPGPYGALLLQTLQRNPALAQRQMQQMAWMQGLPPVVRTNTAVRSAPAAPVNYGQWFRL